MRQKPIRRSLVFLTVIALALSLAAPALAANANGYATREQAISEIVQCVGRRELVDSEYVLALFDDGDQVSEQYRMDVSRAVIAGITAGSNHKLRPTQKVTRLEVMLMLSKAVGDVEPVRDPITFPDTPASAREDIDKLTAAGLVGGAGGKLHPNNYITLSELSALTGRADEVLSTVSVGESFYGYINNKSFRNAELTTSTVVDAVHGAVIQQTDSWSPWLDITGEINADEMEILTALMDGSLPYEQGTPEQRVHDLLLCLADGAVMDEEDRALIQSWRDSIWKLKWTQAMKRKLVQICAFGFTNMHITNFNGGKLYTGSWKQFCTPGLNCYSCPAATLACPIGALQAVSGSMHFSFSFYIVGFLMAVGVLIGRFVCGWLCPFGLIQELIHKIPSPKFHLPKWCRYIKYAVLVIFVGIMPVFVVNYMGAGKPAFCQYICPSGTLLGGFSLIATHPELRSALGWLFSWKTFVLVCVIVGSVLVQRFFCKVLCPLGAIYGLLNKISFLHLSVDGNKCVSCGKCARVCPMDVDPVKQPRSAECIRCGHCAAQCPARAIHLGFADGKKGPATTGGTDEEVTP